ncbi:glycosyltransferase [Asaia krungthepensis]|uniref:sucrose-phosphate synthase n=1 Tax=Asaia krungthepensis NRIC 0535 TaxID=1307925 RepID=A0ABQ0Q6V0_9PROT|nr:glycosyltransferase [Asaia krungthepensis]GBQ93957.1 glycosyltransferase [Asaia krungthepensis NRIC 0535]
MHILHIALGGCLRAPPVIYGITPDTGGHIAYVLEAALAQARRPDVTHVTIVTRRFRNESLGSIHDQAVEPVTDKVTILRIGPQDAPYREKDEALSDLPGLAVALHACATLPDRQFDVIHTHFSDAAALGLDLGRALNLPVIYTPHALGIDKLDAGGTDCPALRERIRRERTAIASSDGIIVSTRDEAYKQIPRYGVPSGLGSLRLITPGVPTLASAEASQGRAFLAEHLAEPDRPIILAIARAVRKKNLAHLARSYAQSPDLQERANLVILSGQHEGLQPGTEEHEVVTELKQIRASGGLDHCFALPPSHRAADVAGLYRLAAQGRGVFVNPALHEPFGLTLLEAASVGLPVIATNRGGPVDIIRSIGHGLLVSPDSLTDLSQALRHLLGTPALWRKFADAANDSSPALGWQEYAAHSVSFYRQLIESRHRPEYSSGSGANLELISTARGIPSSQMGMTPVIVPTTDRLTEARA